MKKPADLLYPKILLVDSTAREQCQLALIAQNQPTRRQSYPTRAQQLPENINSILESADVELQDLRSLAVLRTEGSLTGLRVGLAAVNTLAWLNGLPIIEIDQLNFDEAISVLEQGKMLPVVIQTQPLN